MTYSDWRENPSLAEELAKVLNNPVLKHALNVCDGMTAAKTLGNTSALTQNSNNAHVLFGFDAGRASIISDLQALAIVPEEVGEVKVSYTSEF
jgi:hypothetical protein